MFYTFECPHCDHPNEFEITFESPGRLDGRPEDCFPPSSREINGPENCEGCGEKIDEDSVYEKASEKAADDAVDE